MNNKIITKTLIQKSLVVAVQSMDGATYHPRHQRGQVHWTLESNPQQGHQLTHQMTCSHGSIQLLKEKRFAGNLASNKNVQMVQYSLRQSIFASMLLSSMDTQILSIVMQSLLLKQWFMADLGVTVNNILVKSPKELSGSYYLAECTTKLTQHVFTRALGFSGFEHLSVKFTNL